MTQLHQELNRSHIGVRPSRIEFDLASGFVPPNDPDPVNWAAAGTKLTLRQLRKFCDDQDRLAVVGGNITLPSGIWVVRFECRATKTGTAADELRIAITSGGIALAVSEPLTAPIANPATLSMSLEATLLGGTPIEFRAAQTTTGTDFTIEPDFVGYVERYANPEQDLSV